jgi:hypothetical protein
MPMKCSSRARCKVRRTFGGVNVASPGDVPQRSDGEFADTREKGRARIEKDQEDFERLMGQFRQEAIDTYRTRVRELADAAAGGAR